MLSCASSEWTSDAIFLVLTEYVIGATEENEVDPPPPDDPVVALLLHDANTADDASLRTETSAVISGSAAAGLGAFLQCADVTVINNIGSRVPGSTETANKATTLLGCNFSTLPTLAVGNQILGSRDRDLSSANAGATWLLQGSTCLRNGELEVGDGLKHVRSHRSFGSDSDWLPLTIEEVMPSLRASSDFIAHSKQKSASLLH